MRVAEGVGDLLLVGVAEGVGDFVLVAVTVAEPVGVLVPSSGGGTTTVSVGVCVEVLVGV